MNRHDAIKLDSEISANETRAEWGAWAIVVGLVFEVGLALAATYDLTNKPVEHWGSVLATSIIAIGVYCEIHFGRKSSEANKELRAISDEKVAEANARAAEANERSAQLEKEAAEARKRVAEIERLTGWRHVPNKEGFTNLVHAIEPIAKSLDVLIEYERGDPEATSYAMEIALVFASAGVEKIRDIPNQYFGNLFGLGLTASSESNRQTIQAAFSAAGMSPLIIQTDLSTHLPRNETAPNVYVFVGAKPPPAFAGRAVDDTIAAQSAKTTR